MVREEISLTFPKQHYLFKVRGFYLRLIAEGYTDTPRFTDLTAGFVVLSDYLQI